MEGFVKQKIVLEIECETQFSTGEQMVLDALKFPAIKSVKIISCSEPKPFQIPKPEDIDYFCVAQEGSCHNNEAGTIMRPGTCLVFPYEDLEERAEKIEWDKPIIGPDTPENMIERHEAWDKQTNFIRNF